MYLKRLEIDGFKSFAKQTVLEFLPPKDGRFSITAVVGPNGSGKSNVVDAIRWVMGETSAKRMRGGSGMEDVIFNGTDARPARNFAEVSLLLDNSDRSAPAAYNSEEELEITRKIEKDKGSLYKVNGKTQRARDVQMLFADTVTGANSPALEGRYVCLNGLVIPHMLVHRRSKKHLSRSGKSTDHGGEKIIADTAGDLRQAVRRQGGDNAQVGPFPQPDMPDIFLLDKAEHIDIHRIAA